MATCTRCSKRPAVFTRFNQQLCSLCLLARLSPQEWLTLAPQVTLMTALLLGVSVFLPYETIHLLKMLLAQLHG
jgi:hypothetical protein